MKENEMERIAREAREFRENESRRIAFEKEEARRAKELRKQLELARIALESSKFLKDAAEEQKAMATIKELEHHLLRQDELSMLSGVAEKAQLLLEREELERRLAEERAGEERRKQDCPPSRFPHIASDYPNDGAGDSEKAHGGFSSDMDTIKDKFETPLDMTDDAITSVTRVLKKRETVYYDANSDISQIESTVCPANDVTCNEVQSDDVKSKSVVEGTLNPAEIGMEETIEAFGGVEKDGKVVDGSFLSESSVEISPEIAFDDIPTTAKTLKKRETIYYDTQTTLTRVESTESGASGSSSMPLQNSEDTQENSSQVNSVVNVAAPVSSSGDDSFEFEEGESRALAMLLEGQDNLSHQNKAEAGEMSESIIKRRTGRKSRKPVAGKSKSDDDDLSHPSPQVACFEIPIEYNSSHGNLIMGRIAQVSLSSHIPPSRVDGNWSGVIEGKASVGQSAGLDQSSGSVTLNYSANQWSKLSLGMIRGHELFHPLITIGGSLMRLGSTLGITFYHNASFLHSMVLEHFMYSIAFRYAFAKSRWIILSELSRRQDLSLIVSNPQVTSTICWSIRKPENSSARLELRPIVSEDRVAHIFGECRSSGIWQVGASLVQSLHSNIATVGIGVRLYSTRGLEWLISWTRGEATIRIPVVVSSTTSDVHVGQVLYFAMLSFLIQEAIAEIWGWKHVSRKPSGEHLKKSKPSVSTIKSRHDAEVQQGLMARQAKRKLREETDKDGLVVHEALYTVEGGATWQVTIPLQFWVNQSSLCLPSKPKSQLLGFYSVSLIDNSDSGEIRREVPESPISSWRWWKNVFTDLINDPVASDMPNTTSSGPIPTLAVLYDFQGQRYQITVGDHEELVLPNPRAKKV